MPLHQYEYHAWEKFFVIPSEMFDLMMNHREKSYQPDKFELIKSEEEMQRACNTTVVPYEKNSLSLRLFRRQTQPVKLLTFQQDKIQKFLFGILHMKAQLMRMLELLLKV